MVSKFSVEQRLAILREYDAGGISLIELGAKYAVNESTLSVWRRRHLPPSERKCTVCGGMVPRKAVTWRGSLLCGTCSRAKKTAAHRIYVAEHKEQVDAYRRVPNPFKEAKHKADLAEKWFRNREVLKRIYQRMVDRFGDWEDDYSIVSGEGQLSNPCFIVVDKNGRKRKEVLTEPLPSWELAQKKDEATAIDILRDTLSDSELKSWHVTEPEEVQSP